MKNILVPIDFSETAKNAFLFAQSFTSGEANLKIVHAIQPEPVPDMMYPTVVLPTELSQQKAEWLDQFVATNTISKKTDVQANPKIKSLVKVGLATDIIIEESATDTDLIIMGSTGTNGWVDKVFGSVSTHVAQHAHCPVMFIPQNASYKGFQKIAYATNEGITHEAEAVKKMIEIMGQNRPEIHFVHVKNDIFNYFQIEEEAYKQFMKDNAPDLGFKMAKIRNDEVMKGLHQYADEQEIDLIALATKHRNWLEQLFHNSMTKRMILNVKTPLLVMHYED